MNTLEHITLIVGTKRGIKMGQNILDDKKQKLPYFEEQKIYLSLKSTCR
jgi:hypothetical protein